MSAMVVSLDIFRKLGTCEESITEFAETICQGNPEFEMTHGDALVELARRRDIFEPGTEGYLKYNEWWGYIKLLADNPVYVRMMRGYTEGDYVFQYRKHTQMYKTIPDFLADYELEKANYKNEQFETEGSIIYRVDSHDDMETLHPVKMKDLQADLLYRFVNYRTGTYSSSLPKDELLVEWEKAANNIFELDFPMSSLCREIIAPDGHVVLEDHIVIEDGSVL